MIASWNRRRSIATSLTARSLQKKTGYGSALPLDASATRADCELYKRCALNAENSVVQVGTIRFSKNDAERSGKFALDAEGISKRFESRIIARDVNLRVQRGDRVAIFGPNGSGKTTLLKVLTKIMEPDGGTVVLGASLEMVTLDERRECLGDPKVSLEDSLTGGEGDHVTLGGAPVML